MYIYEYVMEISKIASQDNKAAYADYITLIDVFLTEHEKLAIVALAIEEGQEGWRNFFVMSGMLLMMRLTSMKVTFEDLQSNYGISYVATGSWRSTEDTLSASDNSAES